MRRFYVLAALCSVLAAPLAAATIFGTVRGLVQDPQHRPVPDVLVVLKAKASTFTITTQTGANGEFQLDAVSVGEYTVTVSTTAFAPQSQAVAVLSGTAQTLHFELQLAPRTEAVNVSAEAAPAQTESVTTTTLIDREQIQLTPGASYQ
jgi:hypothetical protein